MRGLRAGCVAGVAVLLAGAAPDAGGGWFVPPPPAKGAIGNDGQAHIDWRQDGSQETITVHGKRLPVQRDPHGEETRDYQPAHSLAATPEQRNSGAGACEGAAYQTIGGQAATGADITAAGGGAC